MKYYSVFFFNHAFFDFRVNCIFKHVCALFISQFPDRNVYQCSISIFCFGRRVPYFLEVIFCTTVQVITHGLKITDEVVLPFYFYYFLTTTNV